jgi:flavin-binding protein dodecin
LSEFDIIEKAGVSYESYSDAVKNALKTIKKQVHWFEVVDQRGRMTKDNKIEFQVVIKIGCS